MLKRVLGMCVGSTALILGVRLPAGAALTRPTAREMLRQGYYELRAGHPATARDLALRVYEQLGDYQAVWPGPGGWVPPPEIDLSDYTEAVAAQLLRLHTQIAERLSDSERKRLLPVFIMGTSARMLLIDVYVALGEPDKAAPLLEQQLWYLVPETRERVLRELKETGRRPSYPRRQSGPSLAEVPGTKWTRARWAAAMTEATVWWDEARREAVFSRDNHFLVVRPGEASATLDGQPFQLERVPYIENDHLILPLSALTQAFGVTLTNTQIAQVTYRLGD